MEKSIISDSTIQILLLTILSIAGIHFYEIGFCRYFNIPTEYISFELNKYSYLLFVFLATLYFIALLIDSFVAHFISFLRLRKKFLRILLLTLLLAFTVFALYGYFKFLTYQEIIVLIFVFLIGLTLILNKSKPDNADEVHYSKYSINKTIFRKVGAILGPILIVSSLICAAAFCFGYVSAEKQGLFTSRPDNKTVLLRKYGDNIIYGTIENNKIVQIIIEQKLSKIDTFHIMKIK